MREELLSKAFVDALTALRLDAEVLDWVRTALKSSQEHEAQHHREALERLRTAFDRLQSRLEAMYVDKLDGKVSDEFYDARAAEWRAEQDRIKREIDAHEAANQSYLEIGVRVLELASKAHRLFVEQAPRERRRLLDLLVSNSSWANGRLAVEFRKPLDLLATTNQDSQSNEAAQVVPDGLFETWGG